MNCSPHGCPAIARLLPGSPCSLLFVFCCSFMALTRESTVNYNRKCINQNN